MRRLDCEELKNLQLDILQAIHECCVKHNIQYWLDTGTLLGAIRHNGYIPWDDDVDIGMLREDYNRFRSIFNSENKRYRFVCAEDDDTYCFAFGKVLDSKTVLYEPDKNGRKIAVYVDVFVYDNAPDNPKLLDKMYKNRDFFRGCNTARTQRPDDIPGLLRKIIFWVLHVALKVFPKNYFTIKMVENSKTYSNAETRCVGNFTSRSVIACDKDIFSSFILHKFEGKEYFIPIGYDKWLKAFYGNYMQLPPVEKRVPMHKFEAYMLDE